MRQRLRIVLAVHLVFFLGWGIYLLKSHAGAPVVWLETSPVDPRDYLSGNYVALRFDLLEHFSSPNCPATISLSEVYLRLEPSPAYIQTLEGPVKPWVPVQCVSIPPTPSDPHIWIRGFSNSLHKRIEFGIERFFVSEGNPLRSARSGQVIAKISINSDRGARILDLVRRR